MDKLTNINDNNNNDNNNVDYCHNDSVFSFILYTYMRACACARTHTHTCGLHFKRYIPLISWVKSEGVCPKQCLHGRDTRLLASQDPANFYL